jgi:hypothetical protein
LIAQLLQLSCSICFPAVIVNTFPISRQVPTYTASSSRNRWFKLYGTHSVPLLKHFAHFDSLSTGSHLILCLLHSAPFTLSVPLIFDSKTVYIHALIRAARDGAGLRPSSCSSSSLRRFCGVDIATPFSSPINSSGVWARLRWSVECVRDLNAWGELEGQG